MIVLSGYDSKMTVEDLLATLATLIQTDRLQCSDWHHSFVANVNEHAQSGRSLSTEQCRILLQFANRVSDQIVAAGVSNSELQHVIAYPSYRNPPYTSSKIPKEVRHIGSNILGFRFKYNEMIVEDIKSMRDVTYISSPYFNGEFRLWMVPVTRETFKLVKKIIHDHRFEVDQATEDFLALSGASVGKSSTLVVDSESGFTLGNVCANEMLSLWLTNVVGAMHV